MACARRVSRGWPSRRADVVDLNLICDACRNMAQSLAVEPPHAALVLMETRRGGESFERFQCERCRSEWRFDLERVVPWRLVGPRSID